MQIKLLRQADRSLELLDGDEAKYADELTAQQEAFVGTINNLAAVSNCAGMLYICCYLQPTCSSSTLAAPAHQLCLSTWLAIAVAIQT